MLLLRPLPQEVMVGLNLAIARASLLLQQLLLLMGQLLGLVWVAMVLVAVVVSTLLLPWWRRS
jgi:hypothetical protein